MVYLEHIISHSHLVFYLLFYSRQVISKCTDKEIKKYIKTSSERMSHFGEVVSLQNETLCILLIRILLG